MSIPLAQWRADGRIIPLLGYDVFVRQDGPIDAPALLLIHGFPTSSWDWEALWTPLRTRFHLITLDLLGFGFSAKPRHHPYRIAEQADLCQAVLAHFGVREFEIIAHDYGDTVTQELLARANVRNGHVDAARLRAITFLNGGLFPESHRPRLIQTLLAGPLGRYLVHALGKRGFARNMRAIFGQHTQPSAELLDGFWQGMQANHGRAAIPSLLRYLHERRQYRERWVGALLAARIPLQFIAGADDPISGAHMVSRYRQLVPRACTTLLPGIGHYPQCEAPAAVLAQFDAFQRAR